MSRASYSNTSSGEEFAKIYIEKALRLNQETCHYKDYRSKSIP